MENMIVDFSKKIFVVNEFMKKQGLEFLVVGSGALLICGMPLKRSPKDVDIEVIADDKSEKVLKALADAYGNNFYQVRESYPQLMGFEHKPYIFRIGDVEVNAWAVKKFTHENFVFSGGIRYATVTSVLRKKMSYRRPKDLADLNHIVMNLLSIGE